MTKTVQIRARTDEKTKREAEKVLSQLGLNPTTAINMFYRQIAMRKALPFPAELPNAETAAAIEEARAGSGTVQASDLQSLLTKLLTKRERTVDVADLVEADPDLLNVLRRVGAAGE